MTFNLSQFKNITKKIKISDKIIYICFFFKYLSLKFSDVKIRERKQFFVTKFDFQFINIQQYARMNDGCCMS